MNTNRIINGIIQYLTTPLNKIWMRINGVSYGRGLSTRGLILIINGQGKGGITIGDNVHINSSRRANPVGNANCTTLHTISGGHISIGNNVGISNTNISSCISVIIEDGVTIGGGGNIMDSDFHSMFPGDRKKGDLGIISKPVRICKNAFIGSNVTILKGTTIGESSIIGASSVCSGTIPANEIWAGNPARFIRKLYHD